MDISVLGIFRMPKYGLLYIKICDILMVVMFSRFKKKPEPEKTKVTKEPKTAEDPKVNEEPRANEESKSESTEKAEPVEEPLKKAEKNQETEKPAKESKNNNSKSSQAPADLTAETKPVIGIKEYSSVSEIEESIDKEVAETKTALGEYLRQMDDKRAAGERTQKIFKVVAKIANKKPSSTKSNQIDLNGLQIVLDANPLDELTVIESVVKSHQQRLNALEKARGSLQTLDKAGDTEGIKYLALEKEGIPEQILLKLA
jgi:hypothetical protein